MLLSGGVLIPLECHNGDEQASIGIGAAIMLLCSVPLERLFD